MSQGFPNPDDKQANNDKDFRGQGIGNLATSMFSGLPVGGSLGGTALVVSAGAQTRWANIFTGVFALIGVLLFARQIEILPVASLAGILVLAGFQSIKIDKIRRVIQANYFSAAVFFLTLIATLYLPVQKAILLGVVFHFLLFIFQSAERMTVMRLMPAGEHDFHIGLSPKTLPSHEVTFLLPQGSLFFAAARDFEEEAPKTDNASHAAVIIDLGGRQQMGSTILMVFNRYAQAIRKHGGRVWLVGVNDPIYQQLEENGLLKLLGKESVVKDNQLLMETRRKTYQEAVDWLETQPLKADADASGQTET